MITKIRLSRRKFIAIAAASSAVAGVTFLANKSTKKNWLVSACTSSEGQHFVAAFDLSGQLINQVKLPARGHDVIAIPNKPGHALVFARRPGMFALEINFVDGVVVKEIHAEIGSHFYGHGIISSESNLLITSENDISTGQGQLVFRDASNYQVVERFASGGIGPHQLALMPDRRHLVIANGGIETHPAQPRKKLNLDSMKPNLAYMEISSGKIIDSFQLNNHQLSIRHLAVSQKGKVVAGLQYQGVKTDLVPLAISHHGGDKLNYLSAENNVWRKLNQYTASVCIDDVHKLVAISCPRADLITYWSLSDDSFIASEKLSDGAGLAFSNKLYASSGKGRVIELLANDPSQHKAMNFEGMRWDNHMAAIVAG